MSNYNQSLDFLVIIKTFKLFSYPIREATKKSSRVLLLNIYNLIVPKGVLHFGFTNIIFSHCTVDKNNIDRTEQIHTCTRYMMWCIVFTKNNRPLNREG